MTEKTSTCPFKRGETADGIPLSLGAGGRRPGRKRAWAATAAVTCVLAVFVTAGTSAAATPSAAISTGPAGGGQRADPSDGGVTGLVTSISGQDFTLQTATGVTVSVSETSTTVFTQGKSNRHVSSQAVRDGASVFVAGRVDSTTITAARVTVQPGGDGGAAAAEASGVIAFQQGSPSPEKAVGTIPAYTEGEGTILNGPTAYKAAKAAQAIVPGGIADRVVQLDDGEYEVHNISINWPHHVFVNQEFEVVGYE
ncbi:hypothetical protein OJ963_41125 [Streptomyces sp. RS2]|uniref:hypothetical protein n=1 Tax=Streptomyces sp. RS2 TaxID=1451205 RepID=UPI0021F88A16|nr:hypothetical protein [Streptomyces sp. RS2]MCW1100175.1 hypothetical protein [Streptomyces sp. RS2]